MGVGVAQHVRGEHELRMDRLADEAHADLVGQAIPLSQVAAQARRDHVDPGRLTPARAWHDVIDGQLPEDPRECDGWLATGSRHSVYEGLAWIDAASGFVRDVSATDVPFVGVTSWATSSK